MTPPGLTIVGLGDSTTAGTPGFRSPIEAPPEGEGNPESQYAYWIVQLHPAWTVLNRGVNGERSDQILRRFDRDVRAVRPDYVILLAGVNDIYQGFPTDLVRENLTAMADRAAEAGIAAVLATILPYNTASAAESRILRQMNRWIEGMARHRGLVFCDTHRAVADPQSYDRLATSPDGLHPDVAGYRRMGEALAAAIEAPRSGRAPAGPDG